MTEQDIISVAQQAIYTMLKIGVPLMGLALVVGLIVSLLQALTSIQEMTLTFVPKIIILFVALIFFMPFMVSIMTSFSQELFTLMVQTG